MKIEIGTLLSNKKGEMFTVYEIKDYSYKGEKRQKLVYYPISDNGLITKTKAFTCKADEVAKKFTVLDWKFNQARKGFK